MALVPISTDYMDSFLGCSLKNMMRKIECSSFLSFLMIFFTLDMGKLDLEAIEERSRRIGFNLHVEDRSLDMLCSVKGEKL